MTGYTKIVWKCQKNEYINFTLTLTGTLVDGLGNIDPVVTQILTILGEDVNNADIVTFYSIVTGSVVYTGSVTPTTLTQTVAASILTTGLASTSTIGGLPVASSSVTHVYYQEDKTPMIVGAVIGSLVGVGKYLFI